jgi:hypothetical protein
MFNKKITSNEKDEIYKILNDLHNKIEYNKPVELFINRTNYLDKKIELILNYFNLEYKEVPSSDEFPKIIKKEIVNAKNKKN